MCSNLVMTVAEAMAPSGTSKAVMSASVPLPSPPRSSANAARTERAASDLRLSGGAGASDIFSNGGSTLVTQVDICIQMGR